jgi:ABC-2 type transport system ATP-binding protein
VTQAGIDVAISSTNLTKQFGRRPGRGHLAVDHIDLAVPAGSVYGFLGPNGSGKTTTIRLLLGLIRPTEGSHTVLGQPMPAAASRVLPRVGALVEGPAFHPYLSGLANLLRLDSADRTADPETANDRVHHALERVGLLAAAKRRYRVYSLGMRQRLAIAAALLHPRDLLVLDEPTNGLDPQGTREVRTLLTTLAATGVTVMLSTHLLSEVEQICSHVGVMHVGRLVAQGSLDDLRARTAPRVEVLSRAPALAAASLTSSGLHEVAVTAAGRMAAGGTAATGAVTALLGAADPAAVLAALVHADAQVYGFRVLAADLEEMFVDLTGEGFDVSG